MNETLEEVAELLVRLADHASAQARKKADTESKVRVAMIRGTRRARWAWL